MKISKLFHLLYAFLMFLPIVLFIPNAFYYGFNEHATNSETTTINYKYQSNEVNSVNDLVTNNIYFIEELHLVHHNDLDFDLDLYAYDTLTLDSTYSNGEIVVEEYNSKEGNYIDFYVAQTSISMYVTNLNNYCELVFENYDITFTNLIFSVNEGLSNFSVFCISENYLPQYTDYNVIESVEINTNDTISNKMYQAWQSTWNLPLLQWTHNSFVAQPFTYITGLFGVPSDSTLNYIFAYFFSISICWLVFDLLMYVPNLAHRWLDRSALE